MWPTSATDASPPTLGAPRRSSVVSAKVIAIRMERFEARGALQLSVQEWQAETAEIATMVEEQLARRFRDWV